MGRGQAAEIDASRITEIDWAYLAGRIDADGSIGCYKHSDSWIMVRLDLYSNDLTYLESVRDMYGGYICKNNTTWQWNAGTPNLVFLLTNLIPYLKTKKDQAQHALNWRLKPFKDPEVMANCTIESKRLNGRLSYVARQGV